MQVVKTPFSFKATPDRSRLGRYRWTIFHFGEPFEHSDETFETSAEAEAAAVKRMQELISEWRAREDRR